MDICCNALLQLLCVYDVGYNTACVFTLLLLWNLMCLQIDALCVVVRYWPQDIVDSDPLQLYIRYTVYIYVCLHFIIIECACR